MKYRPSLDLSRFLRCEKMSGLRSPCLGVSIGRQLLTASRVHTKRGKNSVQWEDVRELDIPMFEGVANKKAEDCLYDGLSSFADINRSKRFRTQVALAGPAVSIQTFSFQSFKKSSISKEKLLRLRFADEMGIDADSISCTYQHYGLKNDQEFILGVAIDTGWLNCIKSAFQRTGLVASSIEFDAAYAFNQVVTKSKLPTSGGFLVYAGPESWTIMIWDELGVVHFVRSLWQPNPISKESSKHLFNTVEEIERIVKSYTMRKNIHEISQVFIAGSRFSVDAIAEILNQRTVSPCRRVYSDYDLEQLIFEDEALRNLNNQHYFVSIPL